MKILENILLVDDDPITNMMHERLINKTGRIKNVLVANDGKEALDLLEARIAAGEMTPELIFLDINMPRMGGFEFLEEYERRHIGDEAQMIIVMLSTSLLAQDHARAEADPNVHSFANKPVDVETFHSIVDEYIAITGQQS